LVTFGVVLAEKVRKRSDRHITSKKARMICNAN